MKKVSLSQQVLLLFCMILCACSIIFGVLMMSTIGRLAEQETYNRLGSYLDIVDKGGYTVNDNDLYSPDFEVAFISGQVTLDNQVNYVYSSNLTDFISDIDPIFSSIRFGKDTYGSVKNENNKNIYYYARANDRGHFDVFLTNSTYINKMRASVFLQSFMIFLFVIILAVIAVGLWSNYFVKRIHKLQRHINTMDSNNYAIGYTDGGLDEIGHLSDSVENLRTQIKENEGIKQEMLQNVSHDFKTPIAVIKSYAEAIDDGMADENACNIIIEQADLLKKKVNKLLQYNRLKYLEKKDEFESVNLKEIVTEVVNIYKFQTEVKIEMNLEDVYMNGYKENFYTVVDNILDNAKRYAKSVIKITLKNDSLEIYNDGDPIDEQFLEHGFKAYEKGSKGQFGLGMSIVVKTLAFFELKFEVKNCNPGVAFTITK